MFRVITRRLRTATFECCGEQLPLPQWHISLRSFSSTPPPQQAAEGEGGGWVPNWMRSRLPAALGGNKEEISELEGMTLDAFASSLTQARRLGSITGFVHGTSGVNDPAAQGTLRLFETIISAMQPEEKADLSLFNSAARQRVATEAGCTVSQVDDCIARYLWTKNMASRMAQLRREGREMPKSIDELEKMVGSWRGYKSGGAGAGGGVNGGVAAVGPDGETCPLAGMEVGKNTKCPKTRKAYKACCGRKAPNK